MKLTKSFTCVPPGEIYPVELAVGDECPEEYEDSARAQGCLGKGGAGKQSAEPKSAAEPKPAEGPEAETPSA